MVGQKHPVLAIVNRRKHKGRAIVYRAASWNKKEVCKSAAPLRVAARTGKIGNRRRARCLRVRSDLKQGRVCEWGRFAGGFLQAAPSRM